MIKVGNRVILFDNMGIEGTVVNLIPVKIKTSFTGGTATNSWKIVIQWDNGNKSTERISSVMRID